MITVYNLICNNRADQVAIARNIAEQLTEAYNGTDLTAAVEAFAKLYQERKEMDFCNPTEWNGLKLSTKTKWSTSITSSRVKHRHSQRFRNTKSPLKRVAFLFDALCQLVGNHYLCSSSKTEREPLLTTRAVRYF